MPVALVVLLLDITLIYHASKTGRLQPWAFIILMVPLIGALASLFLIHRLADAAPEERWTLVGMMRYRSRRDMIALVATEGFAAAHDHFAGTRRHDGDLVDGVHRTDEQHVEIAQRVHLHAINPRPPYPGIEVSRRLRHSRTDRGNVDGGGRVLDHGAPLLSPGDAGGRNF